LRYDHRSSKASNDPYDLWSRLRAECPVLYSEAYGGFWVVTRYPDVKHALSAAEEFSTVDGVTIPAEPVRLLPLQVDPPLHRQYRLLLNDSLSPEAVAKLAGWARQSAQGRLSALAGRPGFDACDFAEPFGHSLSMYAVGFPEQDLPTLEAWNNVLNSSKRTTSEGRQAASELVDYLLTILDERSHGPEGAQSLISVVARGSIDDRTLDQDEKVSLLTLLIRGGFHTTGSAISGAILWLADHPGDRQTLADRPELLATAVDEFVRWVSPISHMRRTATTDTVIGGCPIAHGERVLLSIGSANRDETSFSCPNDVILDRRPNRHVGFGWGPHRCVGSHLGKLGVQIAIEELLVRFPEFEIEDHTAIRWHGSEGRRLTSLPIRVLDPSTAS
jgi:cytochrome P450